MCTVCSHSTELGGLIKGVQSNMVSERQPGGTAVQSRGCEPLCAGKALGWELHLRLFEARLEPLPWQNLWEWKVAPSPHLLQGAFLQGKDSKMNA